MAGGSTFTWAHALHLHSTLSPFDSPLPQTHSAFKGVKPISWERRNIAGLLVTLYGLQELPKPTTEVTCLWLLHGRGDTQDSMAYTAAALLHAWNRKRKAGDKYLIAICLDQRNHGSRMLDNTANVSWKQGNPTHGPDMFNLYTGTALDVSLLISHLPAYLPSLTLTEHICLGVSLGGHATWQLLMNDPRVRAGIVVIGCPDYIRLMTDRAVRSKVATCMDTNPPGLKFIGSKDFPPSLIEAIKGRDAAATLFSPCRKIDPRAQGYPAHPPTSTSETSAFREILAGSLSGKKILCLSGGKDRLVPYVCGEPFLACLKSGIASEGGWLKDAPFELEDVVDPDGRHEFSALMRREAERWLCDLLADETKAPVPRESKM